MLVLPLFTVHIGAHPVRLAPHAPRAETNDNAQILTRSQPLNGHSTNGHPQHPQAAVIPQNTDLSQVRGAVLSYANAGSTEEKGRSLQHLSTILRRNPQSGIPDEQSLLSSLEFYISGLIRHVGTNLASGHESPVPANGHSNGNSPNGHPATNGHPLTNGHPPTNGDSHLDELREAISSYRRATTEAQGEHLQRLLTILTCTSGTVPVTASGVGRETPSAEQIRLLTTYAEHFEAAVQHAVVYYHDVPSHSAVRR
jgi:hypothetical protein